MKLIELKVDLKYTKGLLLINTFLLIVAAFMFFMYKQNGSSIPLQWEWAAQSLGIISPVVCSVTNAFILTGLLTGLLPGWHQLFSFWKPKLLVSFILLGICFFVSYISITVFIFIMLFSTSIMGHMALRMSNSFDLPKVSRVFIFIAPVYFSVFSLIFSWAILGKDLFP